MSDVDTPWAHVLRRRAEGATNAPPGEAALDVAAHLRDRGRGRRRSAPVVGIVVMAALLSAPWLALVGLQFASTRLWPTFLSALVWLATTPFFMALVLRAEGTPLHLGAWLFAAWLFAAWPAVSAWLSTRSLEAPVTALIPEVAVSPAQ